MNNYLQCKQKNVRSENTTFSILISYFLLITISDSIQTMQSVDFDLFLSSISMLYLFNSV